MVCSIIFASCDINRLDWMLSNFRVMRTLIKLVTFRTTLSSKLFMLAATTTDHSLWHHCSTDSMRTCLTCCCWTQNQLLLLGAQVRPRTVFIFSCPPFLFQIPSLILSQLLGEAFDWTIASDIQKHVPFFLAGGLSPDNVSTAVEQVTDSCQMISYSPFLSMFLCFYLSTSRFVSLPLSITHHMQMHPFAFDVSSGVESEGSKDAAKIQAFVKNAKLVSDL